MQYIIEQHQGLSENQGIFSGKTWFLVALTSVVMIVCIGLLIKTFKDNKLILSLYIIFTILKYLISFSELIESKITGNEKLVAKILLIKALSIFPVWVVGMQLLKHHF